MTLPYISKFSTGYYLLENACIEETDDVPIINDHCYALIQDEIYGVEGTPVLFRYPGSRIYFTVFPDEGIDENVIGLPSEIRNEIDVSAPSNDDFLITRPKHAKQIHRLSNIREQIFV